MKTGAVVVAAGLSSRMGKWKALLPYENTTISRYIISQLKDQGLDPIMVVTGHRSEELEDHLSGFGVRFIKNEKYRENQMFDSYRMGIQAIAIECGRILLMPVDKPAIRTETFVKVLASEGVIVRTVWEGEPGHPILLQKDAALQLCQYTGDRGMRGAMKESGLPITNIPVKDRGAVWDLDTPEDYQEFLLWQKRNKSIII